MYTINKGSEGDFAEVLNLIKELAEYENALNEVDVSIDSMKRESNKFEFFVAKKKGVVVGVAIYFSYYSTWKGGCLYLEDLVVTESERRRGVGKLLFDTIVQEARHRNSKRLMWQVLDWNRPAIDFYKSINAQFDSEWINCKLDENQIQLY